MSRTRAPGGRRRATPSCLLLLAALLLAAPAQAPPYPEGARSAPLEQPLPLDPRVIVGQLDNGLRYYVRENRQPENRAELRLVVDVGSVLEDDDQLGLAHFAEHMAFNGTEHFAKQELIDFMESIGMRLGPDVNAYTSFDETVYILRIPTDSPEIMETAFQILEDWAHAVTFEDEEIDKERGVVIEEWRLGRGAPARMRDKQLPILLRGSRYAERLPIGTREVLEGFAHDALRRFYRDWYRPELMAVIAVGDFDSARVMELIEEHFGRLPPSADPRSRPQFEVPDHDGTLFAIATDKEASLTTVALYHKLPPQEQGTVGAYRRGIVEELYRGMLRHRLTELAQKPDPPFIGAVSFTFRFARTRRFYMLGASVREDGIERGLEALLVESERAARFGFTESELQRQKAELLREVERRYAEREDTDSSVYARRYIRHFLEGEPVPGVEYELELHRRFLPQIALEEVNDLGRKWLGDRSRVVVVSAPDKADLHVPTEAELAAVLEGIAEREIIAYVDTVGAEPLLADLPEPGHILEAVGIEELGITEWRLSNGARVVLMPTEYQKDEVAFRAFSPGGSSLASDEEYVAASTAAMVVARGGVGKFNAIDLDKKLAGKVVRVSPYIDGLEEGLRGRASPRDLETLFQLIHLWFTAPRADAEAFEVMTSQLRASLANRRNSPEWVFYETVQRTMSKDHPRRRPLSVELVDEMDLDASFAFYRDRFADASDFTFVFVGSFDLETIRPLVERYLGALPAVGRQESWRDEGVEPPEGVVEKVVRKGVEPKSQTSIIFHGPFEYDRFHRNAIRALALVLETRLRDLLREELGGTYGVRVAPTMQRIPRPEYRLSISFGSAPGRLEELTGIVFEEVSRLQDAGPSQAEVDSARETLYRRYETDRERNGWWVSQLTYVYREGRDPRDLLRYEESLEELSPEAIRAAARAYLDTGRYVRVSLYPEGGAPRLR